MDLKHSGRKLPEMSHSKTKDYGVKIQMFEKSLMSFSEYKLSTYETFFGYFQTMCYALLISFVLYILIRKMFENV